MKRQHTVYYLSLLISILSIAFWDNEGLIFHVVNLTIIFSIFAFNRYKLSISFFLISFSISLFWLSQNFADMQTLERDINLVIFLTTMCYIFSVKNINIQQTYNNYSRDLFIIIALLIFSSSLVMLEPLRERDVMLYPWGVSNRASFPGINSNSTAFIILIFILGLVNRRIMSTLTLMSIILFLTASRGAFVAALFAVNYRVGVAIGLVFGTLSFLILEVANRVANISDNPRISYWKENIDAWASSDIDGILLGSGELIVIDSSFINILITDGIFGLLVLLSPFAFFYLNKKANVIFMKTAGLILVAMLFYEFWGQTKVLVALATMRLMTDLHCAKADR